MNDSARWCRRGAAFALPCLLLLPLAPARAQAPAQGSSTPPRFLSWRYDEDYSYLSAEGAATGEWWESLKLIPLGGGHRVHLTLGAELRARYEGFNEDLWGDVPNADHGYLWLRALPVADLHVGKRFRVFTEFISAFEFDDEAGAGPIDEDRADVLQAFSDVAFRGFRGTLTLRGGRQILAYGSERLVSARYGPNVLRSFDAVKCAYEADAWRVDLLYGRPVDPSLGAFDDSASETESMWAAYATRRFDPGGRSGAEVYYIGYDNHAATFDQGTGHEHRHTIGSRVFGASSLWDWNFEIFTQFGSFAGGNIRAWSIASDTGYKLHDDPGAPRIGLKADVISGDHDPGDDRLGTFNPLFPNGKYFGEMGLLGPFNLIDLHPTLEIPIASAWTLGVAAVSYWRESARDGIYDNGGALLRTGAGSDERHIGTQIDTTISYAPSRTLEITASYSAFLAGDFIEDTGRAETVRFAALELLFRF